MASRYVALVIISQRAEEMAIELDNTVSVAQIAPNQYEGKFAPGPVRFREDGGAWRRINTDLALSGGVYVPADTPYRLEVAPDGGRRIYPDRQDLSKYVDFSVPSWLAGLSREVGRNFIKVYGNKWTLTLSVAKLGVKLDVVFDSLPTFTSVSFPVSVTGYNVNQLLSSGRIQRPILTDAEGTVRELAWSYQAGELRVNLDFSGLIFPVVLDPTFSVAASLDDVYVRGASTFDQTETSLFVGNNNGDIVHSAMRFALAITKDSTINSCYLTVKAAYADSSTTVNTNLYFEQVDNAAQIANYADFFARTLGNAVAFANIGAWTLGESYDTPSLSSILQVIVNRAGWISGQYINLFWKDNSSSGYARRRPASWNNTTYTEPVLTVTWTLPAAGGVSAAYYYNLYGSGRNRG